jgi:hypothetical protein
MKLQVNRRLLYSSPFKTMTYVNSKLKRKNTIVTIETSDLEV